MNIKDVMELLGDKIFTVTFVKKNGEVRVMNARRGVKKHLKGGELPYDPYEHGLVPVFDMQKEAYRMINSQTITEIKSDKKVYVLKDGQLV
jgi:hypothetical protein